jgi:hypothetical protein
LEAGKAEDVDWAAKVEVLGQFRATEEGVMGAFEGMLSESGEMTFERGHKAVE